MNKQNLLIKPENEAKIDKLISEMTIDEKIGQLNQVGPSALGAFEITLEEQKALLKAGRITKEEYEKIFSGQKWDNEEENVAAGKIGSFLAIRHPEKINRLQKVAMEESRLGIPLLIGLDVVHGMNTIFPIPLAEACSWDVDVYKESARISAKEARTHGINWTFAPMVDVGRDSRWGRVAEGAGEDTYLTSKFAAAKVEGFQGDDLSNSERVVACAKHFAAYGAAIAGRDYNSADISLQTLWETYLPPFKAASDAGVASFMTAFNDINGVPCSNNKYLLTDVLRDNFGFKGLVVSDAGSIGECLAHGNVADRKDAARKSFNAGAEVDMVSRCFVDYIKELIDEGDITLEQLDNAVRNILRVKFALNLFENPYVDLSLRETVCLCDEHRAAARDAARRSAVLLENDGVLPIKNKKKIVVLGELADMADEMLGTWAALGRGDEGVSLVQGLKNRGVDFTYSACYGVETPLDREAFDTAIKGADLVIATLGELRRMSGEASSYADIALQGDQIEVVKLLKESGIPFVSVLFNGRPMPIPEVKENSNAVLEAWHLGTEAGNAICDILFGDYNPSARLTTTFPNKTGECPIYYNHVPTGRPRGEIRHSCKHLDVPLDPLYPFGYGLSYTEYAYSDLSVELKDGKVYATFNVKNIGDVAGEETVQLYIHDVLASRVRPVRELKGFKKVLLNAGETKSVTMEVDINELGFYSMNMEYVVEKGDFELFIGHDSTTDLKAVFTV